MTTCGRQVYWWGGEYEGECELPDGHEPDDVHFDGMSWFDDQNHPVADDEVPAALIALAEAS